MTLATTDEDGLAWCSNLFYAYLPQTGELIFTSGENTLHVAHFTTREQVAASIVLESRVVGKLQGIQLRGVVTQATESIYKEQFLKAFPYAVFSLKEMWRMEITSAKYTDNTLGFGTKLHYNK